MGHSLYPAKSKDFVISKEGCPTPGQKKAAPSGTASLHEVGICLNDQQRISVTEETILVFNCFFIGFHGQFITGKGAGHDQQAGLG